MKKIENSLPPNSQKWVRTVEESIDSIEKFVATTTNINRQQDVNLGGIAKALTELGKQHEQLSRVIQSIPISQVLQDSRETFTLRPNVQTILSLEVTPPEGKTNASIFAVASSNYNFSGAQSNVPWWDITIGTDVGQKSTDSFWKIDTYSSVAMHSAVVSWDAEEPPLSIPVEFKAHVGPQAAGTTPGNKAQLQVIAVFN